MKEQKKKNWLLMAFLVFIMIGTSFSVLLFGFQPATESIRYNGQKFDFVPKDNLWVSKISGKTAVFSFQPKDVLNINFSEDVSSMMQNRLEIDATYDEDDSFREPIALAQHQMALTLENYNVYLRRGFTSNNTFNLPVITCADATQNVPVIYFRNGTSTRIYREENCIIAEAKSEIDALRIKDRLLYAYFGIK